MSEHAISKLAEQRMRQWAIGLEVRQRVEYEATLKGLTEQVHPYLAISRDTGAGAGEIAHRVGDILGWQIFDRELLSYMVERFQMPKRMVEFVDETTISWLVDTFGKWLDRQMVTESEYINRLGQIVLLAAQHDSAVFVGRGAQFFLPRDRGVAIQIVAQRSQRIERVTQRDGLSYAQAQRYLETTDRARRDFIREHFHRDVTNPHLYDLVLNLEYLEVAEAVELIVSQCERRFGSKRLDQGRQAEVGQIQ